MSNVRAFRSTIVHCTDNGALEHFSDGLLVVEDGRVSQAGPAEALMDKLGSTVTVTDLRGKLLIPGLIDCHVHYPQIDIIGSYGAQLLDWLNDYAFPAEMRFADEDHAHEVANVFADALLQHGTTTALVFATVHAQSVGPMFEAARRRNMRLITGKVMMDVGCPEPLRDTPESSYRESRALIEEWHGVDRLGYAITPRFALTSSAEQLAAAGRLATEFEGVHIHTHLAENQDEIDAVAARFPRSRSYLDVYKQNDLVRERAVFAHCLYVDDEDRKDMAAGAAGVAFCPSSNLFLGSGLFDLEAAVAAGVRTGIGTDVGGGTSVSVLRTLGDAYKALHLRGQSLSGSEALFLATLGAAQTLHLDDRIGNFAVGKEADFVVLDPPEDSLSARRIGFSGDVEESFFALMTLGDDRVVHTTYLMGEVAYQREARS